MDQKCQYGGCYNKINYIPTYCFQGAVFSRYTSASKGTLEEDVVAELSKIPLAAKRSISPYTDESDDILVHDDSTYVPGVELLQQKSRNYLFTSSDIVESSDSESEVS